MVDYPIKIPPGSEDLFAGRGPGSRGRRCGPFFHGTNIYLFLLEAVTQWSDLHIEVWKSEDQGETWSQQDSANDPDIEASSGTAHFDAQATYDLDVISKIYVLYTDTNGDFRVHPFNTTTDSWETVGAAGVNPLSVSSMQMARRPVGVNGIEFPIAFNHTKDSGFSRVYFTVYRPATDDWLTPVRLFGAIAESESYLAITRASGPSTGVGQGRVHFFARKSSKQIVHKSVESNDTINAQEDIDGIDVSVPKTGTAKDGSEIIVPYIFGNQDLKVARATSSASMTWTIESVLTGELELTNGSFFNTDCIDMPSAVRVYFVLDDVTVTDSRIEYSDDGGTSTWSSPVVVHQLTDPTFVIVRQMNVAAKGAVVGNAFTREDSTFEQAHYTQEGILGPDAGMINQVDTVSGGGYIAQ